MDFLDVEGVCDAEGYLNYISKASQTSLMNCVSIGNRGFLGTTRRIEISQSRFIMVMRGLMEGIIAPKYKQTNSLIKSVDGNLMGLNYVPFGSVPWPIDVGNETSAQL